MLINLKKNKFLMFYPKSYFCDLNRMFEHRTNRNKEMVYEKS